MRKLGGKNMRHTLFPARLAVFLTAILATATCFPLTVWGQCPPGAQGETTTDQRVKYHSTLYDSYKTGKDLRKLAAASSGPIEVSAAMGSPLRVGNPNARYLLYPNSYLREISAQADAVVVVVAEEGVPYLIDTGDFIFTDWTMAVEEVVKDNAAAPIATRGEIIVTRAGGELVLDHTVVRAIETRFRPFVPGGRYVLFLWYVQATGAYRAFAEKSFELTESGPQKGARILAPRPPWTKLESENDPQAFISEVRFAVAETR